MDAKPGRQGLCKIFVTDMLMEVTSDLDGKDSLSYHRTAHILNDCT